MSRAPGAYPLGGPLLTPGWVFVGLLVVAGVGVLAYELLSQAPVPTAAAASAETGTASINSRPSGALVSVDGVSRGVTPLKLDLPLGTHVVQLQNGSEVRSVSLTIEAGMTVSHHVDLIPPAPQVTAGALDISSDPPGAEVRLDGSVKGKTPLTVNEVPSGEHTIIVGKGATAVSRRIKVAGGATASVVVSPKQEGAIQAGWVTFKAPVELRVFEEGRLIGTTSADRLMIPSGRHEFELVSEPLEFRAKLSVSVGMGQVVTSSVSVPNGSLSVNALPWAEVSIDGREVGITPLANLSLPIGSHEIVWRHPDLGERRRTITVQVTTPARIGLDFTK